MAYMYASLELLLLLLSVHLYSAVSLQIPNALHALCQLCLEWRKPTCAKINDCSIRSFGRVPVDPPRSRLGRTWGGSAVGIGVGLSRLDFGSLWYSVQCTQISLSLLIVSSKYSGCLVCFRFLILDWYCICTSRRPATGCLACVWLVGFGSATPYSSASNVFPGKSASTSRSTRSTPSGETCNLSGPVFSKYGHAYATVLRPSVRRRQWRYVLWLDGAS